MSLARTNLPGVDLPGANLKRTVFIKRLFRVEQKATLGTSETLTTQLQKMPLFRNKQPGHFAAMKFVGKLSSKTREFRDMIILAESDPQDRTETVAIDAVSYSEIGMFILSAAVWRIDSNPAIDLKLFFPILGKVFFDNLERTAEKDGREISRTHIHSTFSDRYTEYSAVLDNHRESKTADEISNSGIQILWSLIVNSTNKKRPSGFVATMLLVPDLHNALQRIYRIVDG